MPISIVCSHCEKNLKVAEASAGKKIRCPACKGVLSVPEPEEENETPVKKKAARVDVEDEDGYGMDEKRDEEDEELRRKKRRKQKREDDERRVRRRRSRKPHRGILILVIGILAIVSSFIPILGFLFGAIALRLARTDLPEMESGRMDQEGQGLTQAGNICGYAGIVLGLIACVTYGALNKSVR